YILFFTPSHSDSDPRPLHSFPTRRSSDLDRALLFKTAVKEIAYRHGIMATFMAKISESLPGCGGHIHQSLWDDAGKSNLFYDRKDRKSTRLNSSHVKISYAVFCLKKKK